MDTASSDSSRFIRPASRQVRSTLRSELEPRQANLNGDLTRRLWLVSEAYHLPNNRAKKPGLAGGRVSAHNRCVPKRWISVLGPCIPQAKPLPGRGSRRSAMDASGVRDSAKSRSVGSGEAAAVG